MTASSSPGRTEFSTPYDQEGTPKRGAFTIYIHIHLYMGNLPFVCDLTKSLGAGLVILVTHTSSRGKYDLLSLHLVEDVVSLDGVGEGHHLIEHEAVEQSALVL